MCIKCKTNTFERGVIEKIISKMLLFKTNYLLYYFLEFSRLCRRVQAGLTKIYTSNFSKTLTIFG